MDDILAYDFSVYQAELDKLNLETSELDFFSRSDFAEVLKKQSEVTEIITLKNKLNENLVKINTNSSLLEDEELKLLVQEENSLLENENQGIVSSLKELLFPKDPRDKKNAILEIRAAAGGDEASLFALELSRAYKVFAESNKLKFEILESSESEVGGYKEAVFEITGLNAYKLFKYESGVHRVQRIPETEAKGRVHTSTITIAVLAEAEEKDLEINQNELRIDVFRSGGNGGQSVNTTDSAVRITHIPTGVVVVCQDERSQLKNKVKAMGILRSRLYDAQKKLEDEQKAQDRGEQVGTGDRSEKIRTYNFPQDRVTDHRINHNFHNITGIMLGDFGDIYQKLSIGLS